MTGKAPNTNVELWKGVFAQGGPRNRYPHSYVVSWYYKHVHRALAEATDKKVLDIGCGTAADLYLFATNGFHYHGLDVDTICFDDIVEVSRMRGIAETAYTLAVFEPPTIPCPDESFDVVIGLESIHFNATPEAMASMIAEIHRVLKSGGFYLFTTINHDHYFVATEHSRFISRTCLEITEGFPEPTRVGLRYYVFSGPAEIAEYFREFSELTVGGYHLDMDDGEPDAYYLIFGRK